MYGHKHGMGPVGRCICPKCGHTTAHQPGLPCQQQKCPKCGARMMREGSWHHNLVIEKKLGRKEIFPDPERS
jgi:predicted nucleic-acid-binding Zn-ribbon protein